MKDSLETAKWMFQVRKTVKNWVEGCEAVMKIDDDKFLVGVGKYWMPR